jgi:hypothetical protein
VPGGWLVDGLLRAAAWQFPEAKKVGVMTRLVELGACPVAGWLMDSRVSMCDFPRSGRRVR